MLTIELSQTKASRKWRTTTKQRHYPHGKPAITYWYDNGQKAYEAYYLNHQRHRENGKPAVTRWYKNGQKYYQDYYLNGILYTPREPTC